MGRARRKPPEKSRFIPVKYTGGGHSFCQQIERILRSAEHENYSDIVIRVRHYRLRRNTFNTHHTRVVFTANVYFVYDIAGTDVEGKKKKKKSQTLFTGVPLL